MELGHIGKHCAKEDCKLLDFLPFTCDACNKIFCLDHRLYAAHNCATGLAKNRILPTCPLCEEVVVIQPGEDADRKVDEHIAKGCPKNPKRGHKCDIRTCKSIELVPIVCRECHLHYCLNHRLPQDHKCPRWVDKQERVAAKTAQNTESKSTLQYLIDDLRNRFMPSYASPGSAALASKVQLMKVKSKAIGDPKLDESKRFYLEVIFPQDSKVPSKMMYFNGAWSVGKTLDAIADAGKIINNNNVPGAQKLRLYCLKTGEPLPNMRSLNELGDWLRSGDPILLEKEQIAGA